MVLAAGSVRWFDTTGHGSTGSDGPQLRSGSQVALIKMFFHSTD